MLNNPILKIKPNNPLNKDFVKLTFDFKIIKFTDKVEKNDEFIFDDEIFLVNFGEAEKFTSDYIYQSKLTVFKENDKINFGGYAPDWRRKADLLKNKNGETKFDFNKEYHVEISLSKYRVYIDINHDEILDTYGNARDVIDDVAFYQNKGFEVEIKNVLLEEFDSPYNIEDETLKLLIDKKCFCNYLGYHFDNHGVYFDRLNIIQNIKARTRNSGQYQSNVMLDFITDSKTVSVEYEITDSEVPNYEFKFGCLLDNNINISKPIRKVNKAEKYIDEYQCSVDGKNHRFTMIFPTGFSCAIKSIKLDKNSYIKPVKKDKTFIFLGDSITEGAECFDPECMYVNQVCRFFNANTYDFAVSGTTFNEFDLLGEYDINVDYIFIAEGTNSFCMGTAEKDPVFKQMEKDMIHTLDCCKKYFPNAKIIALLPLWRSDEKGEKYSLKETSEKIREVYEKYDKEIIIVDCHDFIPFDAKYFSNAELALHPNSIGHNIYSEKLLKTLKIFN